MFYFVVQFRVRDQRWRFYGWLLANLLGDALDSWSEKWHLKENLWVAGHLLTRNCKARLFPRKDEVRHDVKLDYMVFGSPGVLASFKDPLDEAFGSFREWDPTQEQWSEWRDAAGEVWCKAVADHKARVLKECEVRHLSPTPEKWFAERHFCRLVRFQVLGQTQQELREKNEDVKAVQKALRRTAELVGIRLRSDPLSTT